MWQEQQDQTKRFKFTETNQKVDREYQSSEEDEADGQTTNFIQAIATQIDMAQQRLNYHFCRVSEYDVSNNSVESFIIIVGLNKAVAQNGTWFSNKVFKVTSVKKQVPDELVGVAQPNIESQQKHFIVFDNQTVSESSSWTQEISMLQRKQLNKYSQLNGDKNQVDSAYLSSTRNNTPPGIVQAHIYLTQAPAMFSTPILQKKTFKPSFKVQLQLNYQGQQPADVNLRVNAYSLHDSHLQNIQYWKPQVQHQQELEGAQCSTVIQLQNYNFSQYNDNSGRYNQQVSFEFTDLKFKKSTRMAKRWLVFACQIYNDTIFCLYLLPSIILSRRNDQYWKAHEILQPPLGQKRSRPQNTPNQTQQNVGDNIKQKGSAEQQDSQVPQSIGQARQFIENKYSEMSFSRELDQEDIKWLLKKAGIQMGDVYKVTQTQWNEFVDWYLKTLSALNLIQDIWNQINPLVFCSFPIDRNITERFLRGKNKGAFILRLSSQPGCFVISTNIWREDLSIIDVEHSIIDTQDLEGSNLQQYVLAYNKSLYVLDIQTQILYPKEQIFSQQQFPAQQSQYHLRTQISGTNDVQNFLKTENADSNMNQDPHVKSFTVPLTYNLGMQPKLEQQKLYESQQPSQRQNWDQDRGYNTPQYPQTQQNTPQQYQNQQLDQGMMQRQSYHHSLQQQQHQQEQNQQKQQQEQQFQLQLRALRQQSQNKQAGSMEFDTVDTPIALGFLDEPYKDFDSNFNDLNGQEFETYNQNFMSDYPQQGFNAFEKQQQNFQNKQVDYQKLQEMQRQRDQQRQSNPQQFYQYQQPQQLQNFTQNMTTQANYSRFL